MNLGGYEMTLVYDYMTWAGSKAWMFFMVAAAENYFIECIKHPKRIGGTFMDNAG